jgi:uncharacterized DUF497 family protein
MQFEWDENKNRSNLVRPNLSFQAATEVVYTIRGEKYRIISTRKANDRERRKYYEHIRGPKEA